MKTKEWEYRVYEQMPRLRRYALALTQNRVAAEDLVQDCLERAWDKRKTWRKDNNFRAWLFSIMHNQFINIVRRNKLASDYINSTTNHTEQFHSENHSILRDLERGLARLRVESREVVLLAGLEGMSYKEIAEITHTPIGTVMSRLSRGREELRALMSEPEDSKVVRLK
jgi:RNA polymerase sigma-70 factor (ECF subfamily)